MIKSIFALCDHFCGEVSPNIVEWAYKNKEI